MHRMLALLVMAACSHAARPTITGAALYAQLPALQATGRATVGTVSVRKEQVLTTDTQTFLVAQVIEKCVGGDPAQDVDCTLALLLEQRFTVRDHAPERKPTRDPGEDQSRSFLTSGVVVGLGVAAVAGLVYGAATCEFEGCKAVFGVPLILVGGGVLLYLIVPKH